MTLDTSICLITTYSIGVQYFYDKVTLPLMCGGSWVGRGKITVSGIPDCLNYCVIIIIYIIYNVAMGRMVQPGESRFRNT